MKWMCCFELWSIDVVMYRNARLADIFPRLAVVLSCCRFRKNPVRAQQHGPCCTTRAPVLLFCVGRWCASGCTTRAVSHNTGTRVASPVLIRIMCFLFSGYVTTRAVWHNTGTRVALLYCPTRAVLYNTGTRVEVTVLVFLNLFSVPDFGFLPCFWIMLSSMNLWHDLIWLMFK